MLDNIQDVLMDAAMVAVRDFREVSSMETAKVDSKVS